MTRLAWLYALLLAFAAVWLGWGIAQGGRLQTDLTALLPADAQVIIIITNKIFNCIIWKKFFKFFV